MEGVVTTDLVVEGHRSILQDAWKTSGHGYHSLCVHPLGRHPLRGRRQTTLDSSGLGTFDVSWPARAEDSNGKTSPEELIAAAHSACFSMAFSNGLAKAGTRRRALDTSAEVDFVPGTGITRSA